MEFPIHLACLSQGTSAGPHPLESVWNVFALYVYLVHHSMIPTGGIILLNTMISPVGRINCVISYHSLCEEENFSSR